MDSKPLTKALLRPTYRAATGPETRARIVLGTAGLGGCYGPVETAAALAGIQVAFERGVHAADTAPLYGDAEIRLGQALKNWRGPRIWISTKTGVDREHKPVFSSDELRKSVQLSLERLGVEQIDCLLFHEPNNIPLQGSSSAARETRTRICAVMRELQAAGKASELGLGGGAGPDWDGLLEEMPAGVVLVFNRIDAVCFDGWADVPRLKRNGSKLFCASPTHQGLLTSRLEQVAANPPNWIPAELVVAAQRMKKLADQHGLPLAELALRFIASLEAMDRIVIGARDAAEMNATLDALEKGALPEEIFNEVLACASSQ